MPKQLTDINDIVLNGIYDAFDLGFTTGRNGEQVAQSEEMIRLQDIIHDLEEDKSILSDTIYAQTLRIDDLVERNNTIHTLTT